MKLPIQTLSEDLARRIDEDILGGLAYPSVASFEVPHGFVRISALPRNAPGKVQTHLLPPPEPRP